MKPILPFFFAVLLLSSLLSSAQFEPLYGQEEKLDVIVKAKDAAPLRGSQGVRKFAHGNFYAATVDREALRRLERSASVEMVWPDSEKKILLDVSAVVVNASAAWARNYNGSGVKICVLDTGVDKLHPALAGRVLDEKDFTGGGNAKDVNGHGTHVAGIAAGNDTAYRGMAFGAGILSAKVCDDAGRCSDTSIITGIDWCVEKGAHVLTLSLGGPPFFINSSAAPADGSDALSAYLDSIVDLGRVVTVAAGNSGPGGNTNCRTSDPTGASLSICSPGLAHKVITVGSSDTEKAGTRDALSTFSSRGPTADGRVKPDIIAPGNIIFSSNVDWQTEDDFIELRGTSMSAPHAAGIAALALQARSLSPAEIKALMMNSALNLNGNFSKTNSRGAGRIDAGRLFDEINYTASNITGAAQNVHSIRVPEGGEIRATLYWPENYSAHNNLDLLLLDPAGNARASSISVFSTEEMLVLRNVSPGGNWKLFVKSNSSQPYSLAASHSISTRMSIATHNISGVAYHRVNVSPYATPPVNLDWNSSSEDLDLYLYDSRGELAAASASRNTSSESAPAVPGEIGMWLAEIVPVNVSRELAYSLTAVPEISEQIIDSTPPEIDITSPGNSSVKAGSSVAVAFSAADNLNLRLSCFVDFNGTRIFFSGVRQGTLVSSTLNASDGLHSASVSCSDRSNNSASSDVFFTVDTEKPAVNIIPPSDSDNSYVSRNSTFVNVEANDSLTDISACVFEWNGINESMNISRNGTAASCSINKTALDGTHTYKIHVNDSAGNVASETRNITLDTKPPLFLNITPSNGSFVHSVNENFSVEYVEANLKSVSLYWRAVDGNYTNVSMQCLPAVQPRNCSVLLNLSAPAGSNLTFYFEAADLAGNLAAAPEISATVLDSTVPEVTFVSPARMKAEINDSDSLIINITSSEPLDSAVLEFDGINESMSGSGTSWLAEKRNISDGNHTFRLYAANNHGAVNVTGIFFVFVNTTRNLSAYFNSLRSALSKENATADFLEAGMPVDTEKLKSFRNYTIRLNLSNATAEVINFTLSKLNLSAHINATADVPTGGVTGAFSARGGVLDAVVWIDIGDALSNGSYTGSVIFGKKYSIVFYLNGSRESYSVAGMNACSSGLQNCYDNTGSVTAIYTDSFSGVAAGSETPAAAPSASSSSVSSGGGGGGSAGDGSSSGISSITAAPATQKILPPQEIPSAEESAAGNETEASEETSTIEQPAEQPLEQPVGQPAPTGLVTAAELPLLAGGIIAAAASFALYLILANRNIIQKRARRRRRTRRTARRRQS